MAGNPPLPLLTLICPQMQTAPYRAPELLVAPSDTYTAKIDCWSVGCIIYEMFMHSTLFEGTTEQQVLERIARCAFFAFSRRRSRRAHRLCRRYSIPYEQMHDMNVAQLPAISIGGLFEAHLPRAGERGFTAQDRAQVIRLMNVRLNNVFEVLLTRSLCRICLFCSRRSGCRRARRSTTRTLTACASRRKKSIWLKR